MYTKSIGKVLLLFPILLLTNVAHAQFVAGSTSQWSVIQYSVVDVL
jgi:hypothetical protein